MNEIRFKEIHISLKDGVTLVVEVNSRNEVETVLSEVADLVLSVERSPASHQRSEAHSSNSADEESPDYRLEIRSGIEPGHLRTRNILAFKDGIPQLLRPTAFSTFSDAALTLIFAVEVGSKQHAMKFDDFKKLYDAQNIKSGSPLTMLLNNLKNAAYIDKTGYSKDRTIRLTAKGEKKAIEVLSSLNT